MTSRYNKRELADSIKVEKLYKDTFKAGKIVGYKKFYMEELPDNRFDSVSLLDIIKIIEEYIENIKPDIIYTHFGGYLNIDQKITFEAVLTTIRPIGNEYVKEIYAFETVSSTEWNFNSTFNFKPNYFIDITETLDEKLKAGKELLYVPEGVNGETIRVTKAELLPTCMYVTLEFDSDFKGEDRKKIINKIDQATLVDDTGNVHNSTLKGYFTVGDNDNLLKVKSFEITSFDYDGNFKVILNDFNGENKEITLVKKSK